MLVPATRLPSSDTLDISTVFQAVTNAFSNPALVLRICWSSKSGEVSPLFEWGQTHHRQRQSRNIEPPCFQYLLYLQRAHIMPHAAAALNPASEFLFPCYVPKPLCLLVSTATLTLILLPPKLTARPPPAPKRITDFRDDKWEAISPTFPILQIRKWKRTLMTWTVQGRGASQWHS